MAAKSRVFKGPERLLVESIGLSSTRNIIIALPKTQDMFPFKMILAALLVVSMISCSDALVRQSGASGHNGRHNKPVRGHRSRTQVRKTLGFQSPVFPVYQKQYS